MKIQILLSSALLWVWAPAYSQTPVVKAKPAPAKISPQSAQQMVTRVLRETSQLRGLSIKRAVPSGLTSRAKVERMIAEQIATEISGEEIAATEILLRQLGLAPKNFDLRKTYVRLLGEQVAGYYSSKNGTFYTSDTVSPLELETVMAHELTHALQDQHFDLKRLENWPRHDSDAQLAFSALVEGDATLVMSQYMTKSPLRALGMLVSAFKNPSGGQTLRETPAILVEGLTFPYVKGLDFATNLYQDGDWPQVSAAFRRLPQSTEQILHFEKYLAREAPVKVPLRDLKPVLGQNWTLLDHDVNGEIGAALITNEFLKNRAASDEAAKGWGGDRYSVYRNAKNAVLVVQDTVWDSEIEARQWREAYARRSTARFNRGPQKRGALQIWNAAPDGVWMEQRGRRVLILEGTIGAFNPEKIVAALRK